MTWAMQIYATNIQEYLNKHHKEMNWTISDPTSVRSTSAGIKFVGKAATAEIYITVQPYSACCAFDQLNYFSYYGNEKDIHSALDAIFKSMRACYSGKFGRKLVLNTVQENHEGYGSTDLKLAGASMKGEFYYPHIHSWATSQKAGYLDQPIVNHNTSNIIHHLITFPDVCQADYEIEYDDEDEDE